MINPKVLEKEISNLLDDFYRRRISKISELKLKDTVKRKNPYLYKAIGVEKASEIVEQLLTAYMSSSDEGIFGNIFFEPLAKFVSGGQVSPSEGVDIAIENDKVYKAIAVKSGPSVFNAQSKRRQAQDFKALNNRLKKLQKQFDPIVGYCYGKKKQKNPNADFKELAGQDFWAEITGDEDFYLKIIQLMKEKPNQHVDQYKKAWSAAVNRFTKEFVEEFCFDNGAIDWEKLTKFNSGNIEIKNTRKVVKKSK